MEEKKLICISCPTGCRLSASRETADGEWKITGNRCPRGVAYAQNELHDPRRIVTAVVRSDSELLPCLPVRTDAALPKRFIASLLNRLYQTEVKIPVKCGELLLADIENTGVNVIFSCDCVK